MENDNKVITVNPEDVKKINKNSKKSKKVGRVIKSTTSFIFAAISIAVAVFMFIFIDRIFNYNADFGIAILFVILIAITFLLISTGFAIVANLLSFTLLMTDRKSKSSLIAYVLNLLGMLANISAGIWFFYLLSLR
ncbi:MAG: hypothetical protein WC942_02180 [Clostridia bacterium]|jgi:membrane glycosyltransferase|nr:hypothetical protein [Clostridia bacterium]MDD4275915.1 hypothetical protein [Clostridia bacterium]